MSQRLSVEQQKVIKGTSDVGASTEVKKKKIFTFLSEGSVFFSFSNTKNFEVGPTRVSRVLQQLGLDFRLGPLGSLKIVQGRGEPPSSTAVWLKP